MSKWTERDLLFLKENYPWNGKNYCAQLLGKTEAQIRSKAARMGLRLVKGVVLIESLQCVKSLLDNMLITVY